MNDASTDMSEKESKDDDGEFEERFGALTLCSKEEKIVKMSVRILIPVSKAGGLIGKGGAIIKKFRQESGIYIDIANAVRGAMNRIVTVQGTIDGINEGLKFLAERLSERSMASKSDGDGTAEMKTTITLLVPNSQVGCIIGKGGGQIKETREISRANLKISVTMMEHSTEKTVKIEGEAEGVDLAIRIITRQLLKTQDRAIAKVLYHPRPLMKDPIYRLRYDPYNGPFPQYPRPIFNNNFPNAPQSPTGPAFGNGRSSLGVPSIPQLGSGSGGRGVDTFQHTVCMTIPDSVTGSIIGRKGSVIRDIRTRSRASIKIANHESNTTERKVTITGTRQSNEIAMTLIQDKIALSERRQKQQQQQAVCDGDEQEEEQEASHIELE